MTKAADEAGGDRLADVAAAAEDNGDGVAVWAKGAAGEAAAAAATPTAGAFDDCWADGFGGGLAIRMGAVSPRVAIVMVGEAGATAAAVGAAAAAAGLSLALRRILGGSAAASLSVVLARMVRCLCSCVRRCGERLGMTGLDCDLGKSIP